jgi:O-acetyl-ADP-ribose deacetylase (regulator of RNase III)
MNLKIGTSGLNLVIGNITEQETDAIVNAATSSLMGGGGVDGAIHRAGGTAILEECKKLRKTTLPDGLPTGKAVITTGGKLRAGKVIHTIGPIWKGGDCGEAELLADAYRNSLLLALENRVKSISFPSISTGAYGYPVDKASEVAIKTVIQFLEDNKGLDEVRFVLHSTHDLMVYEKTLQEHIKHNRKQQDLQG